MTNQVMISLLRQGNTASEILSILDTITSEVVSVTQEDNSPTLEVIDF